MEKGCHRALQVRHGGSDGNGRGQLRGRQQVPPEQRGTDDFLWNYDHVPRIELGRKYVSVEQPSRVAANHGAIGANNENFLPVCSSVRASRVAQITAPGGLARP